MHEYFGKTLVLEQWGYEKCTEMQICGWKLLFESTLLRLVLSRHCLLSGAGCLVGIVDDMSVYAAHVSVPAGKHWFLGKSRSNPLCMGEGMVCRICMAWVNVEFRELVSNGELLVVDQPCQPHG